MEALTIEGIPASITRERIGDLIRALGVEPNEVKRMTFEPTAVTITVFSRDEQGRRWLDGDGAATHDLTIPIEREKR